MSKTPHEYAGRLGARLAGGDPQLKELTDLYSQARYGERELPPEQAEEAVGRWVTLREHIRGIGQAGG